MLSKKNKIILVVDDNDIGLKLVKTILTIEGYEVHTATNAEQAIKRLETIQPHLILMDLQLPGESGLALTRRLKMDQKYKNIIIVALTSYAMSGDKQKALDAGCAEYISKPIDTQELPHLIESYLKKHGY